MILKLKWGLSSAVPEDATGAWGCRAIIHQIGVVDLVPDRTDQQGSDVIFSLIDTEFPLPKLRETLGGMLRSGQVRRAGGSSSSCTGHPGWWLPGTQMPLGATATWRRGR
jgi:hypothetical protein